MYELVIVDDEQVIRQGLQMVVDWNSLGFRIVGTFGNGDSALHFLREHTVDAVLADIRMPRLSGLELAALLSTESPQTRVVILSGYDNFRYAQEAIELNVVSYLLKPVREEQIREVFGRLREELDRDRKDRQEQHERERAAIDLSAARALFDVPDSHDCEVLERHFGRPIASVRPVVVEFHFAPRDVARSDGEDQTLRALRDAADLLRKTNGLEHALTHVSHNTRQLWIIVAGESDPDGTVAQRRFEAVCTVKDRWAGVAVSAAVGPVAGSLHELGSAAREAEELLKHRLHLGVNRLIDRETVQEALEGHARRADELLTEGEVEALAREFAAGIASGEPLRYRKAVTGLIDRFRKSKVRSTRVVSASVGIFLRAVREHMRSFGAKVESVMDGDQHVLGQVETSVTLEQIHEALKSVADQGSRAFADRYGSATNREVIRVLEEIKANLSRPLSLERLADRFGLSVSHFSRMFKETVGENFKDYLCRTRMEQAKRLLEETDLRVYEVGCRVGYHDQHYFSEVFRRRTGYTPRGYRARKVGSVS